jgi:hypothetical protein
MKFYTTIALVGAASAIRLNQKSSVAPQSGESADGEGNHGNRSNETQPHHHFDLPPPHEIFESCNSNNDTVLTFGEASRCVSRHFDELNFTAQNALQAEWPSDDSGAMRNFTLEALEERMAEYEDRRRERSGEDEERSERSSEDEGQDDDRSEKTQRRRERRRNRRDESSQDDQE